MTDAAKPEPDPDKAPAGGETLTIKQQSTSFMLALTIGGLGGLLFAFLRLPLPWMLGSMVFVTLASLSGVPVRLPHMLRQSMVVFIGVMLGGQFTPDLVDRVGDWLFSVAGLLFYGVIAMAAVLTYLKRVGNYDAVTAYFSAAPGGLNDMTIIGREMGGDDRVIALTQASRILLVVMTIPFMFRIFGGYVAPEGLLPAAGGFDMPLSEWGMLLGAACLGPVVAKVLRLPAPFLLGPLALSATTHIAGWSEAQPPSALLAAAQMVIGAAVGCRFAGVHYREVLRILRVSLGSAFILMSSATAFGLILAEFTGLPWFVVMLAYAPGGLAEMSLVAIGIGQDVAFVATHHLCRIAMVVLLAPLAFKLIRPYFRPT